ncbi:MAG TPA: DUF6152 family protein, partial [Chloroflexota bacterium]|nr:DUF6152 family protein [Chloroflexota bacterium]
MTGVSSRRLAARSAGAAAAGAALAVGGVSPAAAHHSYPATYDTAQRVTVSGVVQLVRFANPHVHIVLESPLETLAAGAGEGDGVLEAAIPILQETGQEAPAEAPPAAPEAPPVTTEEATAGTLWVLDLPGPGRARQLGLTPETLPPGTPLTVLAW